MANKTFRSDLLYPELSYQIIGVLFVVHRELGSQHLEKNYQRAVASALRKEGIEFREQVPSAVTLNGGQVGRYFVDFVIDGKIVLEIKAVPRLNLSDFRQVDAYLQSLQKELGILANFRTRDLTFKRILNPALKPAIRAHS